MGQSLVLCATLASVLSSSVKKSTAYKRLLLHSAAFFFAARSSPFLAYPKILPLIGPGRAFATLAAIFLIIGSFFFTLLTQPLILAPQLLSFLPHPCSPNL